MASITPIFNGSYSGELIYNIVNYCIDNSLFNYIENMEITYDNIFDKKLTGFNDVKYMDNSVSSSKYSGDIAIIFVGNLPHWIMQQLIQLAKACVGGGMTLYLDDTWATDKKYYCKWENAGDFVENNPVLSGGNMNLKFYQVI